MLRCGGSREAPACRPFSSNRPSDRRRRTGLAAGHGRPGFVKERQSIGMQAGTREDFDRIFDLGRRACHEPCPARRVSALQGVRLQADGAVDILQCVDDPEERGHSLDLSGIEMDTAADLPSPTGVVDCIAIIERDRAFEGGDGVVRSRDVGATLKRTTSRRCYQGGSSKAPASAGTRAWARRLHHPSRDAKCPGTCVRAN